MIDIALLGTGGMMPLPRRWLSSPRSLAIIDRVTGLVLMGFGGTLLADALTGPAPAAARG